MTDMHDMYTDENETESPVKRGISSGARAIGFVLGLGFMWFTYTSVLPNVPVIGPILEATAKPPLADLGPDFDTSSPVADGTIVIDTPPEEVLGDAGPQEIVMQNAAIEAYGRGGAYSQLRDAAAAQTTSSDFDTQWNFVREANGLIEQYLCS